jgi:hypothetical protein
MILNMTTTARKVLSDLEYAHKLLEAERDARRFRIIYVAAMTLSRAIGHVLDKIDSRKSPELKREIENAYRLWKKYPDQHKIFHLFIEDERNSILKEYEIGFMSGRAAFDAQPGKTSYSATDELFCPLIQPPYEGEDCREVLAIAISWWHIQLDEIDKAAVVF